MVPRGRTKIKRDQHATSPAANPLMRRPQIIPALTALSLALACRPAPRADTPTFATGEELVRAMHDRYATTWYRTLSFQEDAIRTAPDGTTSTEVWLEAAEIPGRLWIDTGPRGGGNGVIYRGDSLYVIRGGDVTRALAQRNLLLVLGFDVYRQPVETTMQVLRDEGFRLDTVRTDTWEGRPVYVVGAAAGDSTTKQFWIDAERLVFVRLLEPDGKEPAHVSDIRFEKYERQGGGWVAPRVDFLVDGKRTMLETYSNVRVDVPLEAWRFEPKEWKGRR
jgi:hypothetical protein